MPESPLRLIRRSTEYRLKEERNSLPRQLRGIYVLYRAIPPRASVRKVRYDVLYVGMTTAGNRGGIRNRLMIHARSKRKGKLWTHFSVFEVWDNIRDEEVAELEGLFRHIDRRDSAANSLNIQRGFKKMKRVRNDRLNEWGLKERR